MRSKGKNIATRPRLWNVFKPKFRIENLRHFALRTSNLNLSNRRARLSEDGVTMIEALMVMAVIGFVMSLIAVMAYTGVTAWQKQSTRLQLESQAQNFMYILTEKLRQAQPGTVTIANYPGEMNLSMITFNMVNQSQPVSIYLKSTGTGSAADRKVFLFEPEYVGTTSTASYLPGGQMLASNVISLYFTYPNVSDTSRIQASISLQKYPFQNKPPVTYVSQEEVYVRN